MTPPSPSTPTASPCASGSTVVEPDLATDGKLDTGHWELTNVQRTLLPNRIRLRHHPEIAHRHQQETLASGPPRREGPYCCIRP